MTSYALLQSPPSKERPVVAFDLEGTLTAGAAWRGMSGYLAENGREAEVRRFVYRRLPEYYLRRITGRDMRAFKNRWIHQLLELFRGYSAARFQEMTEWAVEHELWPKRRQLVIDELYQHLRKDGRVIIVTGLFEPYVAAFGKKLPEVEVIGTPIVYSNGEVTGELAEPFNIGLLKAKALGPFMQEDKILSAYGDTYSDRYMLAASRQPVAVYPDKKLRDLATEEGWRVLEEA